MFKTFVGCTVIVCAFLAAMAFLVSPKPSQAQKSPAEIQAEEGDAEVFDSGRDIRSSLVLCLENHGLQVLSSKTDAWPRTGEICGVHVKTNQKKGARIRSQYSLEDAISNICESHGYEIVQNVFDLDNDKITGVHVQVRQIKDD